MIPGGRVGIDNTRGGWGRGKNVETKKLDDYNDKQVSLHDATG